MPTPSRQETRLYREVTFSVWGGGDTTHIILAPCPTIRDDHVFTAGEKGVLAGDPFTVLELTPEEAESRMCPGCGQPQFDTSFGCVV